MHSIDKSFFPTEEHEHAFQRLCNDYIVELRMHKKQMKMVEKDPENYHPYPAPSAHPDIINSVIETDGDYNIEYKFVDNTPILTLAEKKNNFVKILYEMVAAKQEEIIPIRKRNLISIKVGKIASIEEVDRTEEQKNQLAYFRSKEKIMQLIYEFAAQTESDIDDLTEKNIDDWKMPKLPEISK